MNFGKSEVFGRMSHTSCLIADFADFASLSGRVSPEPVVGSHFSLSEACRKLVGSLSEACRKLVGSLSEACRKLSEVVGSCRKLSEVVGSCRKLSEVVGSCRKLKLPTIILSEAFEKCSHLQSLKVISRHSDKRYSL
jgi:hypothetical protein